jgi:hypothetical protein
LRTDGFRVLILFPPREHPPPHVHVVNGDGIAVIYLSTARHAQRTDRVEGMSRRDARRAERLVRKHSAFLLNKWRAIHGYEE